MAEVEPIAIEQILPGAQYVESGGVVDKWDPRREEKTFLLSVMFTTVQCVLQSSRF